MLSRERANHISDFSPCSKIKAVTEIHVSEMNYILWVSVAISEGDGFGLGHSGNLCYVN